MVTFNQAQTGNVVYGAGGTAPNRGQVSAAGAQGYIQRELNNKAKAGVVSQKGADGLSDQRSTVAAQSLNRMQSLSGSGGAGPKTAPGGSAPLPSGGGAKTPDQLGIGKNKTKPPQEVTVTEDGILQLPYNHNLSAAGLEAIEAQQQALMDLNLASQQQSAQYAQSHRSIDENERVDSRYNLNRNASVGTAFSSQYSKDIKDTGRQYTQERADLETANTVFQTDTISRRAAIQEAFNRILNSGAYDNANELAGMAGSLGFGQMPIPVVDNSKDSSSKEKTLPASGGSTKKPNLTTRIKNNRKKYKQAKANGNDKKAKAIKERIRRLVKKRKNN